MPSPFDGSQPSSESHAIQRRKRRWEIAFFCFGIALAILLAGAILGYVNTVRLIDNHRRVFATQQVIAELEGLLSLVKDAETGQRGYLLTEDKKYLEPYNAALAEVPAQLDKIKTAIADDTVQQERMPGLERNVADKLDELQRTLDLMNGGDREAALKLVDSDIGRGLMENVRQSIDEMQQFEHDQLRRRAQQSETSFRTAIATILLSATLGIASVCVAFYLAVRNIRQKAKAAAILAEQKERLHITLTSIGDAVISTDAAGKITFLNPVAEQLTGWTNKEASGRSLTAVFEIVNETTRATVENPADRALREGMIVGLANHTILIAKDRSERFIDDSAAPIRDSSGQIVGAVLVFRDISQRRSIEKESRMHEERYHTLFNTIDEGFCVIEMLFDDAGKPNDYRFLEINPAFEKQTGLVDAIGKRMRELAPDHEELWFQTYGQVATSGESIRFVQEAKALDGRWFDVYAFRVGQEGSPHVAILFTDITERRKSEIERQESELRFRTLVEQVQDYAIFMTDADGRATSWNEGVQRVLGFDEEEFIGQNVVELIFTPEDLQCGIAQAELDQAAAVGSASDDRWMQRKDGSRFWAAGVTTGLHDDAGNLLGFMKVMRDQTERKRLEDELRQIAADLSEADRRKTEFLATLGHELRNPLAPIRTGLEVLKSAQHDPDLVVKVLSTMERQAQQMARLIDDLLDVSRITRGKLELRTREIKLEEAVRSAVEATQPFLDEANHTLTVSLPDEPVTLNADLNRLAQIFSNLLNNAAKYTPDGGHIALTAQCEDGEVIVSVKDDGVGIPFEQQAQIFEMFAQIDRPLEKGYSGLGIGLTLVKQLVELHKGSIEVHSDGADRGSEFRVHLPISGEPERESPAELAAIPKRKKLRVLIVDDNKAAATMLKMVVKMLGNDVTTADDGEQAIAAAEEFAPDIVLMDLGMPRMNGYEAARFIRQQPWGQKMVLVALTGWGQDEDRQRTAEAGFNHHLVKPAEPSDLQQLFASIESSDA
ncbi:PAS domain S-box protein [Blastopirellula sp. JC733]|nr:PAS domain S-box protein [Blastopirellula sediminis]